MATEKDDETETEPTEIIVDDKSNRVVIDEDADDDREEVQSEDKERVSRKDRRRRRYEEMLDKQYERGRSEADARIRALEAQIQTLAQARGQPRQEPEEDEIPPQVREVDDQLRLIVGNISRLPNTDEGRAKEAELEAKYRKLEFKKSKIISELHSSQRKEPDDVEFGRRMLRLEYPQVYSNDLARAQANQEMQDLIRAGHAETIETARLAARNTLARLGIGAKTPNKPSAGAKAKYAATPTQAGDHGGSRTVTLDKHQMQMARAHAKGRTSDDREAAEIFVREILRPNGLA
jgi:hypothetical protein